MPAAAAGPGAALLWADCDPSEELDEDLPCNLQVKVKNTFIDGWDDDSSDEEPVPNRRQSIRTCPDLSDFLERQSELLPAEHAAEAPASEEPVQRQSTTERRAAFEPAAPAAAGGLASLKTQNGLRRSSFDIGDLAALRGARPLAAVPEGEPLSMDEECAGGLLLSPLDRRSGADLEPEDLALPTAGSDEELLDREPDSPGARPEVVDLLPAAAASGLAPRTGRKRRQRLRQRASARGRQEEAPGRDPQPAPGREEEEAEGEGVAQAAGAARVRLPRPKLWCHLYLSREMLVHGFDLNKKIIGHGGSHTKAIFDATGCKVRLRGRGSGHFEGGREAPVHLMLALASREGDADGFREAFGRAIALLRDVEGRFRGFCRQRRWRVPQEGCFWVGEITARSQECLGSALEGLFPAQAVGSEDGGREDEGALR